MTACLPSSAAQIWQASAGRWDERLVKKISPHPFAPQKIHHATRRRLADPIVPPAYGGRGLLLRASASGMEQRLPP